MVFQQKSPFLRSNNSDPLRRLSFWERFFFCGQWSQCGEKKSGGSQATVATVYPIGSMYGIYTNIGGILMVNVTIYGIHGSYGYYSNYNRYAWEKNERGTFENTTEQNRKLLELARSRQFWVSPSRAHGFTHVPQDWHGTMAVKKKIIPDWLSFFSEGLKPPTRLWLTIITHHH